MKGEDPEVLGKYLFDEMCVMMSGVFRIVEYRTSSDAVRAIRQLHNSTLDGRVIYVREVGDCSIIMIFHALFASQLFTLLLG